MERKKRVYNIILNSKDTKSFTGPINNAQYFVNFPTIMDAEALKSSYLVRFRIRSAGMAHPNFGITNVMVLNLGFSSCSYNMSNGVNSRTAGALTIITENNIITNSNVYYIDTPYESNPPMYIDNLNSTTSISVTFQDTNNLYILAGLTNYTLILSFEEQ